MCGGALFWSQIDKVVFAARDEKRGAGKVGELYHPKTKVVSGVLDNECSELMQEFFRNKRK